MTTPTLTPKRAELLHHLDEVRLFPDGEKARYTLGRHWRVNADMAWLLNAGLAEVNPGDGDLDIKGYRPTATGLEWLTTHDDQGDPR